ncbi:unnamed protein product, partial [Phaeothamnion confervicola]
GPPNKVAGQRSIGRYSLAITVMAFLIYSTESTIIFQTFACDHLEELGTSYLRADYSIECNTPTHHAYKLFASFMIFLYPIGIPLLYAVVLSKDRHGSTARGRSD